MMEGPVDLPERQRTLRATIEWSCRLLTESQRELHGVLAVFVDGCTLEDAQSVADATPRFLADLEALVGWSLVRSDLAHHDVRLFDARDSARRGPGASLLRRKARGASAPPRGVLPGAGGKRRDRADRGGTGGVARSSRARARQHPRGTRLVPVIRTGRGCSTGSVRSRALLARARSPDRGAAVAVAGSRDGGRSVLCGAGAGAVDCGSRGDDPIRLSRCGPGLRGGAGIFRELEDDRHAVFALCELARALSSQEELDRAQRVGEEALAMSETAADDRAASAALDTLAMIAGYRGQNKQAQALSERSLTLRRSLGDPHLIATSANTLGLSAMRVGDLDTAERAFEECLRLARELGEKVLTAAALCALGEIALSSRRARARGRAPAGGLQALPRAGRRARLRGMPARARRGRRSARTRTRCSSVLGSGGSAA